MSSTLFLAAILGALPPPGPAAAQDQWTSRSHSFAQEIKITRQAIKRRDPSALARIYRLWNTAALTESVTELNEELKSLLKIRRTDPLVKDHLHYMLKDLAHNNGELDVVKNHTAQLGLATDGWIIGPFENAGNSGHAQSYPPETSFEPQLVLPGKSHPVQWRRIKGLAPHGEVMLAHMVMPNTGATAYGLFALTADKTEKAALRVGASAQVKIFYDGELIYEFDGARGPDFDQINIPLLISKGAHRLLIKSSWERPNSKLLVRVTDPKGGALRSITLDGNPETIRASYKRKAQGAKSKHTIIKVEDQIDQAVKKSRGNKKADMLALRSDLFTLLNLFDRRRLPSPPRTDLENAIKLKPNDPWLRFYFAFRILGQDPALAREQFQAALVSDPKHVPSLIKLADFAAFAGKKAEERQKLEQIRRLAPDLGQSHIGIANIGFTNSFEKEHAFYRLQTFCEDSPSSICLSRLSAMALKLNNTTLSRKLGHASLQLEQSQPNLRHRLAQLAYRAGEYDIVKSLYEKALRIWPFQAANYIQFITYLQGLKETKRADELLQSARDYFPDSLAILRIATERALRQGEKQRAIALLKASLKVDPSLINVRRQYDSLRGEANDVEEMVDDDADKITAQAITKEEQKYGAIYLSDKQIIQLYASGQATRVHQYTIRLHNKELEKAISTQRIYFTPGRERVEILSAERITPEGSIIRADRIAESGPRGKVSGTYIDQRWKLIQFKKIDVGDSIHIRYRTDSVGPNLFGGFFGDISFAQALFPKRQVTRIVQAPQSRPLYTDQLRTTPPKRSIVNKQQRIEWHIPKLDALEREPASPPYVDRGVVMSVSTYENWDSLGEWYAGLIGEQFELDKDSRAAGKAVLEGVTDPKEKVKKLYAYVVKNTRYVGIELGIHGWKPFRASETHRRRYGDCKDKATLLAALLKDNGVDATIALVRTADKGHLPEDHASMWAFNHAITYVPGEDLFLDGTAEFSGTTELPYMDQDGQALIVWPNGKTEKRRIPLSTFKANAQQSVYEARISAKGELELKAQETLSGAFASPARKTYEAADKRVFKLESKLGRFLLGAKVTQSKFENLDNLEQDPKLEYTAKLDKFGILAKDQLSFPVNLFELKLQPIFAAQPNRTEDLFFAYPWSATESTRFVLPPGSKPGALPTNKMVNNPHIEMSQSYTRTEDGFIVSTNISLKSKRVPQKDYSEFRNALGKIDIALSERMKVSL